MALDLTVIKAAIKVKLAGISGLNVFDYEPDSASVPFAYVEDPPIDYLFVMSQATTPVDFTIVVGVGRQHDQSSSIALSDYANPTGSKSIRAALTADPTIGGTCVNSVVRSFTPLPADAMADTNVKAGEFLLSVEATT